MGPASSSIAFVLVAVLGGCSSGESAPIEQQPPPGDELVYQEVTTTNLPASAVGRASMDAKPADIDGDGDLDLIVACEFCTNVLLLNDGSGRFTDGSSALPGSSRDSEDIGVADFDNDGDLDIIFVSEDDLTNELLINDGQGRFQDASSRIPVQGRSNAVVVADLTGDGNADVLIGNAGQNAFLVGDGTGGFADETASRLPTLQDVTQDLELGDADGDGDLDLLVGNEDANRLLINDGTGRFTDETEPRLQRRSTREETREADFGDVDGDGDLDIVFANINAFVPAADPQNRLLINDGSGNFTDETADRLPKMSNRSFDADLVDVDDDGDLDIVASDAQAGSVFTEPIRLFLNNGTGVFMLSNDMFPSGLTGKWFDSEAADLNGDGKLDFYFSSQRSSDRLILSTAGNR